MNAGDDDLADELRVLLGRLDPVPPEVVAAARASFEWRNLDAELARLTADSLLAVTDVRGGEQPRLLSFQVGERSVEIEVSEVDTRLRVLGQLVPVQPARVRVEQPERTIEVVADELGRFSVDDLAPGPTRFVCRPLTPSGEPAGADLVTEWQVL